MIRSCHCLTRLEYTVRDAANQPSFEGRADNGYLAVRFAPSGLGTGK